MTNEIDKGYKKAQQITRRHAKTFYFASKILPFEKRKAAYSIYAICRISDDSVDKTHSKLKNLTEIQEQIRIAFTNKPLNSPLLKAFQKTVSCYHIKKEYFDQLIKGMYADLVKDRYANFKELYDYCFKVAGVLGLIMIDILGYKNHNAKKYAVDLGIAMQLTNITRDIKEDFQRGRIYIPTRELNSFNITKKQISEGKITAGFIKLISFQIKRARLYYKRSEKGIKTITGYREKLTVESMLRIYAAILDKIEKNGYDVFKQRAYVGRFKKLSILSKILLGTNGNKNNSS